jgi:hypothetical protein
LDRRLNRSIVSPLTTRRETRRRLCLTAAALGCATLFLVAPGSTLAGPEARAEPIGSEPVSESVITGRVTDATTHAGLGGIEVCAYGVSSPETTKCVFTESSGSYRLTGLPIGTYRVGFFSESIEEEEAGLGLSPYPPLYWNGKASWGAADILTLGPGGANEVNGELVPQMASTPAKAPPSEPSSPSPVPSEGSNAKAPRVHCRAGQRRKKVKGKVRCVKVHKRAHHKHAHRPSSATRQPAA